MNTVLLLVILGVLFVGTTVFAFIGWTQKKQCPEDNTQDPSDPEDNTKCPECEQTSIVFRDPLRYDTPIKLGFSNQYNQAHSRPDSDLVHINYESATGDNDSLQWFFRNANSQDKSSIVHRGDNVYIQRSDGLYWAVDQEGVVRLLPEPTTITIYSPLDSIDAFSEVVLVLADNPKLVLSGSGRQDRRDDPIVVNDPANPLVPTVVQNPDDGNPGQYLWSTSRWREA